jgi:hypothetical protein
MPRLCSHGLRAATSVGLARPVTMFNTYCSLVATPIAESKVLRALALRPSFPMTFPTSVFATVTVRDLPPFVATHAICTSSGLSTIAIIMRSKSPSMFSSRPIGDIVPERLENRSQGGDPLVDEDDAGQPRRQLAQQRTAIPRLQLSAPHQPPRSVRTSRSLRARHPA